MSGWVTLIAWFVIGGAALFVLGVCAAAFDTRTPAQRRYDDEALRRARRAYWTHPDRSGW